MAGSSDSFKFWESYWDAMKDLTMEQRGLFVTALCSYVFDGIDDPECGDAAVRFGFKAVRGSAAESRDISRAARESGKSGGRGKRKSTHKRGAKSTPLSTPLSTPKRVAKAYSSVSSVSSSAADAATHKASHGAPMDGAPAQPYEDEDGDLVMPDGSKLAPAPPGCG